MLAVLHLVHEREHLRGDELHLLERRLRLLEAALELLVAEVEVPEALERGVLRGLLAEVPDLSPPPSDGHAPPRAAALRGIGQT